MNYFDAEFELGDNKLYPAEKALFDVLQENHPPHRIEKLALATRRQQFIDLYNYERNHPREQFE